MRCSKRGFFVISFSLLFSVAYAASSALPGPEGFPPFPPDQEMLEEDFSAPDSDKKPEKPEKQDKSDYSENPVDEPHPEFPEDQNPVAPPPPLPPKDSDKIFYYRGNRTYSEELPLKINFIKCMRDEDGTIIIMVFFNQTVNPRSVNNECFLIDDNELSENIRFSFNKKGDTIRVTIPQDENEDADEEFVITVQDVCGINGVCIEPVELLAKVED